MRLVSYNDFTLGAVRGDQVVDHASDRRRGFLIPEADVEMDITVAEVTKWDWSYAWDAR